MRLNRIAILAATLVSSSLLAADEDPYTGVYHTDTPYNPYTLIKKVDGRYFARVATGSVELVIAADGSFQAKNPNIAITGQFGDFQQGHYRRKSVNVYGTELVYTRETVTPDDPTTLLYGDRQRYRPASSPDQAQCRVVYPDATQSTQAWLRQSSRLRALERKITKPEGDYGNIDSLLILKGGKLVFEHYYNGWQAEDPHTIQSVTKSLTSLLFGLAEQQGLIKDTHQPAVDYLPAYQAQLSDDKANITLRDFLTMSPGLYWDEWSKSYEDPDNMIVKALTSDDSVAYTLEQPMIEAPGQTFRYSGGAVAVIGDVIAQVTKQPNVVDYARKGPLSSLCFRNAYWMLSNDGRANVGGGAFLQPRDMMKLGQLVLDNGRWQGKTLIDPDWMTESVTPVLNTGITGSQYSYFWWNTNYWVKGENYPAVKGMGYGGQDIVIVPSLDLVVVKTASNFHRLSLINRIMVDHILPTFL